MTQRNFKITNLSKVNSSERKKAVLSVLEKQESKMNNINKVKVESLSISRVRARTTVAHAQLPTLTCQKFLKFETSVHFISASAR